MPQSLRHSQIFPLCLHDFFHFYCCHDCISCRKYTMDCTKVLAGSLGIFLHAALAYNDTDACGLYKFILKLFHSHRCRRTYGYHLVFVISQGADNRAGMQDCSISDIHRNLSSLFYNTTVCHITTGCNISCQVYNISNMNIL